MLTSCGMKNKHGFNENCKTVLTMNGIVIDMHDIMFTYLVSNG